MPFSRRPKTPAGMTAAIECSFTSFLFACGFSENLSTAPGGDFRRPVETVDPLNEKRCP